MVENLEWEYRRRIAGPRAATVTCLDV